jgi:hypothetical protein
MNRVRELVLRLQREWLPLDEFSRLPATARVLLCGLVGWSGIACAATFSELLAIEIAARSLAPVAFKEARAAKLERSNGYAILQRPVFSRTRQAALPVIARPQPPPLPPTASLPAARDNELRLKGVFMNAPMAKAFLISAQNPAGAWVQPEEMFGGWKLIAVRPSDIELENGGERVTVTLGAGNPGKASSQANTSAPANTSAAANPSGQAHENNIFQNLRPHSKLRP